MPAALERAGWRVKRPSGSHKLLVREGCPDYEFAVHDNDEIGRKTLSRIAKHTGLQPGDLYTGLPTGADLRSARA